MNIYFGHRNQFVYTNHRGERAVRTVIPEYIRKGTSPHHKEVQWLLEAHDVVKNEPRTFALDKIEELTNEDI